MWSVSFPSGNHIYLFGTIHLPIDAIRWDKERILSLISDCNEYYGEMDLNELSQIGFLQSNLIPEGKTIEGLFISIKKYEKVRRSLLKSFNIDLNDFKFIRPLLLQHMLDRYVSGGNNKILDHYLWEYAKSQEKKTNGLETLREQKQILNQIDFDYQLNILKSIARNPSGYKKQIRKMIDLYNNQNIHELYKKGKRSTGKYRKLLIYQRNERMVSRILEINIPSVFVSVGVGHLYGNKGILALLKRSGAVIEPILS